MKVNIVRSADDVIVADFAVSTIKEIMSGLNLHYGDELTESLMTEDYRYILMNSANPESTVSVIPEVIGGSLDGFDTLIIVKDICGSEPFSATSIMSMSIAVTGTIAMSASTAAAMAAVMNAMIMMAVSFALNAVMSALSPAQEFSKDPSQSQQLNSNLFNGGAITREQGGIVPLIMGHPYCGGVLISSGISTEDF